ALPISTAPWVRCSAFESSVFGSRKERESQVRLAWFWEASWDGPARPPRDGSVPHRRGDPARGGLAMFPARVSAPGPVHAERADQNRSTARCPDTRVGHLLYAGSATAPTTEPPVPAAVRGGGAQPGMRSATSAAASSP